MLVLALTRSCVLYEVMEMIWGFGLSFYCMLHFPSVHFLHFLAEIMRQCFVSTGVTWAATAAECFRVFMWFVQAALEKAQPPQRDGNDPAFPHPCLSVLTTPQQKRLVSRGMPSPPGPTHISVRAPPFPAVIRAATQRKHEIAERNSSLE